MKMKVNFNKAFHHLFKNSNVTKHFLNDFKRFIINFSWLHYICMLWYLSSFDKKIVENRLGFVCWFQCLAHVKQVRFCKLLVEAQLLLQVADEPLILRRITIELTMNKLLATHAESIVEKDAWTVKTPKNNSFEQLWSFSGRVDRRSINFVLYVSYLGNMNKVLL